MLAGRRAGRGSCPLERRELNDGGVELVYLWLWIHERRLHGGIEQLLSLLAVTGNESGLGEGCVRGSFEGRRVPTSNWSTAERGALRGLDGFDSRAFEYI